MATATDKELVTVSALPAPVVTGEQWAQRRQQFNGWVNEQLRRGIDFGVVPGTDKPTLLKPGAEKIMQLFGCAPDLTVLDRQQDATTGYLYVEIAARAVSITTGEIVATGVGCCSSYESKYRYRWEWWNGRGDPGEGEGWERTRNGKWRRRIANPDLIDVWNTVLKIAKKRALVDLALTISGASEKFTQDIEDFVEAEFTPEPDPQPAKAQPNASPFAEPAKARVWLNKALDYYAITEAQLLGYLDVERLADWRGTAEDAKARIATAIEQEAAR